MPKDKTDTDDEPIKGELVTADQTSVVWNDRTWTMPADDKQWDFEAAEALEKGQGITFLRSVLGREQFAKFTRGTRRTIGDATELMDALLKAHGEAKSGE